MLDLRRDLTGLWSAASKLPAGRGGRVVLFMSSRGGEGASSVAAAFALMAAERSPRPCWLVDLDLDNNPLYTAFAKGKFPTTGRPGRPLDASLGADQIYIVPGAQGAPVLTKLLTAHQIEGSRLLVTRFRHERLAPAQQAQLRPSPGWWAALRRIADWVIVDAPPLSRSGAGLICVPEVDGVVLVVQADRTEAAEVHELRAAVEAQGGAVLGVVMSQEAARPARRSR